MNKIKILHIHTDPKFLHSIEKFQNKLFDNTMLIIGEKDNTNTRYHNTATFFNKNKDNIENIAKFTTNFDLIVFVDLTAYNKKILMKLPKKVKVFWHFFGHELYNKRLDLILTNSTIKYAKKDYKIFLKTGGIKAYYNFLKHKYSVIYHLCRYSKNIDNIMVVCKEEYNFLKRYWYFLPRFIQVPLKEPTVYEEVKKENFFIFGHSRNISNNHLDILEVINNSKNKSPYQTKMFLSYGHENAYYNQVVKEANKNKNIEMITDFLPSDQFMDIYKKASALVINSQRQIALGNIFIAISTNCKIYLNNKNIIKKWFEREGLKVFSIEDFKQDYETNNLKLSIEEAKHNILVLQKMYDNYNFNHFHEKIIKIINK